MRLLAVDFDLKWGVTFSLGCLELTPIPHWRLWKNWGYEKCYYDGDWHSIALGPFLYISWGPT